MSDITQNTPKLKYADNKTQPFKVCVDMMKIGLLLFTAPFLSRLFRALGRHNSKEKFRDKRDHSGDYSPVRITDA